MKTLEFIMIPIKRRICYWQSILLELFTSAIVCFFYYEFWRAVFENSSQISIYSMELAISYSIFAQIVGAFSKSGEDRAVSKAIQSGNILNQLLRPVKLLNASIFRAFGNSIFSLFTKALPIFALANLFRLIPSVSIAKFLIAVCFLVMGQLIVINIEFIIGMLAVWLGGISAVIHMKHFLILVASGSLLPLEFYNDNIRKMFEILPFHFNVSVPVKILINKYDYSNLKYDIIFLMLWVVVIAFLAVCVEKKACRKLEIFMG